MQTVKNGSSIFILTMLLALLVFVPPSLAVDSVTLSPGSDIQFVSMTDSKTLYVQIKPAKANVEVFITVDTSMVSLSKEVLTTDAYGKASFTISPISSKGMDFLWVTADGVESNSITVTNNIDISTLTLSPSEISININENPNSRATFTISPAKISNITITNSNPELVSVSTSLSTSSSGSVVMNIIANRTGVAKITGTLPNGVKSNELVIKICGDDKIIPGVSEAYMKTGQTEIFYVSGGSCTFFWSCKDGSFNTTAGDTVVWTAPEYPGVFDLLIFDNNGKSAQIRVTVTTPLQLSPEEVYVIPDEMVEFRASGGEKFGAEKSPYNFSAVNGNLSITPIESNPEYILVKAPAIVSGDDNSYTLKVEDARGETSQAKIHVVDTMSLSRDSVSITVDPPKSGTGEIDYLKAEKVTIFNGKAPFTVSVEKGNFRLKDRDIHIIPPKDNGTYNMTVKDAMGTVKYALINVEIPGRLQIKPTNPQATLDESVTFTAEGGKAPYRFFNSAGTLYDLKGSQAKLKIEQTDSDISVVVKDSDGATSTAIVQVMQPITVVGVEEKIYLKEIFLSVGESRKFKVTGGSGKYYYSSDKGTADRLVEITGEGELIFTAPAYSGKITLTVNDSRGSQPVSVLFNIKQSPFNITPSIKYMDLGSQQQEGFEIIGDQSASDFKVWTELGQIKKRGNRIIYTPPAVACEDTIHVVSIPASDTDSQIYETTAIVHITNGLLITPAVIYLENSVDMLAKTFKVLGGAGGYTLTAKYGDLEPVLAEPGDTIKYTPPAYAVKDEVITVTDKKGIHQDAMVQVKNSLKISPQMAALSLIDSAEAFTVDFKISGGFEPYTWVASGGDIQPSGQGRFTFTPPSVSGKYTIDISDGADKKVTATVVVTTSFKITPSLAYLRPGESTEIRVMGGMPPYQLTCSMGYLSDSSINSDDQYVTYTAPLSFGDDEVELYVRAYDSQDVEIATQIIVTNTPKPVIRSGSDVFGINADNITTNLTILGQGSQGAVDAYIALLTPDGQFFLFDTEGHPVQDFVPYKKNVNLSDPANAVAAISLKDVLATKYAFIPGKYFLYSALTTTGAGLLETPYEQWLGGLAFFEFEIK